MAVTSSRIQCFTFYYMWHGVVHTHKLLSECMMVEKHYFVFKFGSWFSSCSDVVFTLCGFTMSHNIILLDENSKGNSQVLLVIRCVYVMYIYGMIRLKNTTINVMKAYIQIEIMCVELNEKLCFTGSSNTLKLLKTYDSS